MKKITRLLIAMIIVISVSAEKIFAQYTGSITADTTSVGATQAHFSFNSVFTSTGPAITFIHPNDSVWVFFEIKDLNTSVVFSVSVNHSSPNLGDSIINATIILTGLIPGHTYQITAHNLLYQLGTPVMFADALPVTFTTDCLAPTLIVSGAGTICAGASTQLTATSNATSFSWSPTTGLSNPNIVNPIASPNSTTTYVVTVSNGACTSTASVTVTVSGAINPTVSNPVTVCDGSSATLTAGGGTNYVWNNGLSTNSINVSPDITTTYTVTISNGSGCSATESTTVTVSPAMYLNVTSVDAEICNGNSTTLNATANGTPNYTWSSAGSLSDANLPNPVASPNATTTYVVTADNGTCTASASVTVSVDQTPDPTSAFYSGGILIIKGTALSSVSEITLEPVGSTYTPYYKKDTILKFSVPNYSGSDILMQTAFGCQNDFSFTVTGIQNKAENSICIRQNEQIILSDITGQIIEKVRSPKDFTKNEIFQVKDLFQNLSTNGCYFWRSIEMTQKFIR